jgi:hypothetical protein
MTRPADPTMQALGALEEVLLSQESGYRALRELVRARREAIRAADLERLKQTLDQERLAVSRLGDLDRKRTELAVGLAKRLGVIPAHAKGSGPGAGQAPALSALLAKVPGALRERLSAIAERLRDEINAARQESGIVRDAAERLAQHVAGILQSVSATFASSKTYGRGGRFATAGAIRSIDLTT